MNIEVSAPLEAFIRSRVADGEFESPEEVVTAGLNLLRDQDEAWRAEVRRKIEEGLASVRAGRVYDIDQVREHLAHRKAEWKAAHGYS